LIPSGVPAEAPCVSIVDDDALVLRSLGRLLKSAGFAVRTFPSAHEFLAQHEAASPGCVVLDLAMPGLNGLEVQKRLAASANPGVVVFLSGQADVSAGVQAMKAGAVDFLTKPIDREKLIAAVHAALDRDRDARAQREQRHSVEARFASLTPREREVLVGVVAGRLNKQIAAELGTAEKTVKVHRARVMKKMQAGSLVELVQLAAQLR
jgi:RNA polymerase sigma factor (sigma-70 family)